MKVDVLVAEIGSTTTVVNAFKDLDSETPVFWAQLAGGAGVQLRFSVRPAPAPAGTPRPWNGIGIPPRPDAPG